MPVLQPELFIPALWVHHAFRPGCGIAAQKEQAMGTIKPRSRIQAGDDEAQDSMRGEPVLKESQFGELYDRWRHQAGMVAKPTTESVQRSIECLRHTLEPYASSLVPSELQIYEQLVASRRSADARRLLFVCFQLMCRVRGPATAIVQTREMARLLG
jgi:hypothetical protein